jgi:cytochrome b involved in lipid metabolism
MLSLPSYSVHDVASHNMGDDLWVIIDDKIFDLTNYMHEHPGGKKGSRSLCIDFS